MPPNYPHWPGLSDVNLPIVTPCRIRLLLLDNKALCQDYRIDLHERDTSCTTPTEPLYSSVALFTVCSTGEMLFPKSNCAIKHPLPWHPHCALKKPLSSDLRLKVTLISIPGDFSMTNAMLQATYRNGFYLPMPHKKKNIYNWQDEPCKLTLSMPREFLYCR